MTGAGLLSIRDDPAPLREREEVKEVEPISCFMYLSLQTYPSRFRPLGQFRCIVEI